MTYSGRSTCGAALLQFIIEVSSQLEGNLQKQQQQIKTFYFWYSLKYL